MDKKEIAERRKAFEAAIKKTKKELPAGTVYYKDGKASMVANVERIGLPSVDFALRTGGLPRKRIIEIYGPEHSGKTTLCLHIMAQVQKWGGNIVYLDAENSFDPEWARKLGLDPDMMLVIQQTDAHSVIDSVRRLVKDGNTDLFVVDSVAALTTKEELEGEMTDHHIAALAKTMTNFMKRISIDLLRTKTIALFTNQVRNKIGVTFGSNLTTTGGNAFRHFASIRMEVVKESDEQAYKAGQHAAKVKIAKNKLGTPYGIGHFRIDPNIGIILSYSLIEPAVEMGVIEHEKGSTKYSYKGKTWTYESRLITALEADPSLRTEILEEVYKRFEEQKAEIVPQDEPALAPEEIDLEENGDIIELTKKDGDL